MEEGTFGTLVPKKVAIWYPDSCCDICTAPASGVHYGVVACEGCKAFYRRSVTQKITHHCYFGGNCVVGPKAKGRCRACRFQSCLKQGMKFDSTKMGRVPLRKREVDRALSSLNTAAKAPSGPSEKLSTEGQPTSSPLASPSKTGPDSSPLDCLPQPTARRVEVERGSPRVRLGQLVSNVVINVPTPTQHLGPGIVEEAQSLRRPSVISFVPKCSLVPATLQRFSPGTSHNSCLEVDNGGFETAQWLAQEGWRHLGKEQTIKTVTELISQVHGDDYATWDAFMHDCIIEGKAPRQPQVSLQVCIDQIVKGAADVVEKHCKLSLGLPGFADFSKGDQQTMVSENWMGAWLTTHHKYYRNNTAYYLIGPLQIHYCIYWLQQVLEPEYLRAVLTCTAALNRLNLTPVEAFLLLAIAMFSPGSSGVENEAHMAFLHCHYSDCLISLLRSSRRGTPQSGADFEAQVLGALGVIRRFNVITRKYVRTLDLTQAPFRPKEGSYPVSIPEVMDDYGGF